MNKRLAKVVLGALHSLFGDERGSLIESVVSMTLFGLVGTMLMGALTLGLESSGTARHESVALLLARSQIESIKEQDYAEPISYTTIDSPDEDYVITIGGSVLDPGYLEQIDIVVAYPGGDVALSAYKVNHIPPIYAQTSIAISDPDCPAGKTCLQYHMHNNPTPPVGDTASQANLPLNTTASPAYLRFDYDTDTNPASDAGVSISEKGTINTTDLKKYRNWRTGPLAADMNIDGEIEVHLWAATKDFQVNKRGHVIVHIRSWDGSSFTSIANASLVVNDWMAGFEDFVPVSLLMTGISHTIDAGDQLDVRLLVGSQTQTSEMQFMYDFIDFNASVFIQTTP